MKATPYIQLNLFSKDEDFSQNKVINVSSVPQRSPFRYPGGKTWFVPTARRWFQQGFDMENAELYEPFSGGGIISLTAIAEHYFRHATMTELDDDMAAAWQTILSDDDSKWLIQQIKVLDINVDNIERIIAQSVLGTKERALSTIVRNRTNHGGILAKGSGRIKRGEAGRGIASRWYPETLIRRIRDIYDMRNRITFIHGNAFDIISEHKDNRNAFFYIDPPYTVAGRRLYNLYDIDHCKLFELVSQLQGHYLMTYDDNSFVRHLAQSYGLQYRTIQMQTTHLLTKEELIISDNFKWLEEHNIIITDSIHQQYGRQYSKC